MILLEPGDAELRRVAAGWAGDIQRVIGEQSIQRDPPESTPVSFEQTAYLDGILRPKVSANGYTAKRVADAECGCGASVVVPGAGLEPAHPFG